MVAAQSLGGDGAVDVVLEALEVDDQTAAGGGRGGMGGGGEGGEEWGGEGTVMEEKMRGGNPGGSRIQSE